MVNAEAKKMICSSNEVVSQKVIQKTNLWAEKVKARLLTGLLALEMMPVYAADSADTTVDTITIADGDANTIIGKVLGIIMMIAKFVGSAMFLWGIVMFALSIKNDEPESKQKALMTAFAGVVLFALKEILSAAGIISIG